MEITNVWITLPREGDNPQILAYCEIEFGRELIVSELRYIMGHERAFVAMPSRKKEENCRSCRQNNRLDACYCANCGIENPHTRRIETGRLFADVVSSITSELRQKIEIAVLMAYKAAVERNGNRERTNETESHGIRASMQHTAPAAHDA